MDKRLMTINELSHYLGVPKPTIYTWVCLRRIPSSCIVRLGRSLKFDLREVDKWIAESKPA